MFLVLLAIITLLILGVIASTLYVVRQQTVVIIERFLGNIKQHLVVGFMFDCHLVLIKLLREFNYVCCNLKLLWKQRLKTMFL